MMVCGHCRSERGARHESHCRYHKGEWSYVQRWQSFSVPEQPRPSSPPKAPDPDSVFSQGREIAGQLVEIKARLGRLGLFRTMHALDTATYTIGYELEERAPS